MGKKVVCGQCNPHEEVEVLEELEDEKKECTIFILKCGHKQRNFRRKMTESINLSDSVSTTVSRLISFDSEDDRVEGIYALIESKIRFNGIEKNKFYVTDEQLKLLKSKNIKYKHVV
ncbi:MAG TPA: hypothetical protein VF220_06615 [Nitrososphaeraceae archaeon]